MGLHISTLPIPPHTQHRIKVFVNRRKASGKGERPETKKVRPTAARHTTHCARQRHPPRHCRAACVEWLIECSVYVCCLPSRRIFRLSVIPLPPPPLPWAHSPLPSCHHHNIPLNPPNPKSIYARPPCPSLHRHHYHPNQNRQQTTATPTSALGGVEKAAAVGASSSWSITQARACVAGLASAS